MATPKVYKDRWEKTENEAFDRGGQAHVFYVRDLTEEIPGICALKQLDNDKRYKRFVREAEVLMKLDHPNILKVYDFDVQESTKHKFYVSEFCQGKSFDKAEPFWHDSIEEKFRLCKEICAGLQAAHQNNPPIIHRDMKPDNIYLRNDKGPAVIGDFGLCYVEDGERYTQTQEQVGARFYMHPDLANGRFDSIQPYHDLYSLGKVIYWIFSDGMMFDRERHRETGYDLTVVNNNSFYEHLNRLLDDLITNKNQKILKDVQYVINELNSVERLMMHYHNPIGKDIKQKCNYCGIGEYRMAIDEDIYSIRQYFANDQGQYRDDVMRVQICSHCGNIQFFSLNSESNKNWNN